MEDYYFAKREQICKEVKIMIIMDVKIDNLYAFKNFHINMSYPKKIVESTIDGEYLIDRPNFRYKKINVIMGGNATGKTSLGKTLMAFTNYLRDNEYNRFFKIVNNPEKCASLVIDFVAESAELFRFKLLVLPKTEEEYTTDNIDLEILATEITKKDNYETCKKRLDELNCYEVNAKDINLQGWYFSYPLDAWKHKTFRAIEDNKQYLYILEHILKSLDPSIKEVIKIQEVENTYAIKLEHQTVIIQNGKIADTEILSSGTKAGLDISYIIASIVCNKHNFYYCDELFSYVNSDIEKACLSIIIDKLIGRKQLFFTTHNTDILDMQLPKHSFTFLKKDINDVEVPIKSVYVADYLKRNTDSLRHAVENDLFCTVPDLDKLFEILDF